jgi:hypothetical protein
MPVDIEDAPDAVELTPDAVHGKLVFRTSRSTTRPRPCRRRPARRPRE